MEFFKDNLINWLILVAGILWLWFKMMPAVFEARRQRINTQIDEAAKFKQERQAFLSTQKGRIDSAEKEAQTILVEARQLSEQLKQQIAEQAAKDAAHLEQKIEQQMSGYRQTVITELRSQAAIAALRLAEIELPAALGESAKSGLQDRFVNQLDQVGATR